jgi:two-component system KDP operon response regulator KdpE
MKVLIIEDDDIIIDTIRLTFQIGWQSAQIISTKFGEEGIQLVETQTPDIIILDLGLPDISGFEVIKSIRLFSNIPLIVLTVQTDENITIKALELGANDYICKPFRQLELLARIKTAIRNQNSGSMIFSSIGPFNFDNSGRRLIYHNQKICITSTELIILKFLLLNKGQIVTYDQIAQQIWDSTYTGYKKTLRVYIAHLRKKLEIISKEKIIISHPGIGYSVLLQ